VRELAVDRHGLEGWIAIQQMTGVVARRHTPDGRSQHVPAERTDDPLAQCSWPSTTRIFAMRPCRWRFARASVPKKGTKTAGNECHICPFGRLAGTFGQLPALPGPHTLTEIVRCPLCPATDRYAAAHEAAHSGGGNDERIRLVSRMPMAAVLASAPAWA
jgi:hypothetical protein